MISWEMFEGSGENTEMSTCFRIYLFNLVQTSVSPKGYVDKIRVRNIKQ